MKRDLILQDIEDSRREKRRYLNLSQRELTSLYPEIATLTYLEIFNLSGNQLKSLPPEIQMLRNLRELNLYGNQLTSLPPEISQLTNLEILNLSNNHLKSLPPEISKLKNLKKLYLNGNQLTSLPPEISGLTNLKKFYLTRNLLRSLPSEISHLTNLTELDLSWNQLVSLPPEISHLTNLNEIWLYHNQLKSLPPEIMDLSIAFGNNLEDNPLEIPPIEIIKKGRNALIDYFKSLEGEHQAINEVKVLLIGDGGAGKTSLVKQLLGKKFNENESQTHGINIEQWQIKEGESTIQINFWDFGGQEIMHATHQFFLSKRSLYILVLDSRKDDKTEYWLKHIESFGGKSPIFVILNKIDENPSFDVNRRFLLDKYQSIKGFYRISCKKKIGITTFSDFLKKELANVEHIQTTWPKTWFNVKTELETMTDNFISYSQYVEMCKKENILETSAQDTLVDFLNDLGVVLHFKDFELIDTHVLEPKWVTEAVYKIINSKKLANSKGVLNLNLLDEILKRRKETDYYYYPPDRYKYIIDLMKKFELCYEIDKQTILLPDLLEIQEPKFEYNYYNSLKFIIEYEFLPRSVMPRFIVRLHKDIKNNIQWRTGVVLEDLAFQSTALIRSDNEARKIYIYVNGEQKRDYFSVILFNFREINQSFEKLVAIEKVPMPDEPDIAIGYKHLITLERKGIEEYIPDGSEKEYNVKDLLGTIYIKKNNEEEMLQILKRIKDKSDNEQTLEKKARDIIMLQPNFMGLGVNLNELIRKLFR